MPSTKGYLDFILEQLSELEGLSWRGMMGEYLLFVRGKVFGGIYDDRFLVKPTRSALELLPHADREAPYPGGREMLLVENVDDREFLARLVDAVAEELPAPKKRGRQRRPEKGSTDEDL